MRNLHHDGVFPIAFRLAASPPATSAILCVTTKCKFPAPHLHSACQIRTKDKRFTRGLTRVSKGSQGFTRVQKGFKTIKGYTRVHSNSKVDRQERTSQLVIATLQVKKISQRTRITFDSTRPRPVWSTIAQNVFLEWMRKTQPG